MKKTNILKIALTLVMAFMLTGAFAQVAGGDYSEYDSDVLTPTNVDFVTVGATMGYYALPDPIYHPLYDFGNGWTLDAGGSWTWTVPANPGTAPNLTYPTPANYVEIEYLVVGDYTINVAESFAGGCTDLSPTVMETTVLPVPTAELTGAAADASWDEITANYEYQRCSALPGGEDLTATFTETGVLAANAHYAYGIQLTRTAYNALGVPVDGPTVSPLINYLTTAKADGATDDGGSMDTNSGALSFYNDGIDDFRTVYVFTLIKATDAPGAAADGIISQISQKSNYLDAAVATHAFVAGNVTYNLNLPPVTGPIYYISNTFYN
jgi:hypothetical protein